MNNPKYILVDSKYKINNQQSNNFRYYLPKPIHIQKYLKINYLYMPRTNYLINSNNNNFDIIIINNNQPVFLNVYINEQNFTPILLATYINSYVNNNLGFRCVYNEMTYKFEFSCDQDFRLDFSKSNFYKLISMDQKIYNSENKKIISGIVNFNNP